MSRWLWCAVAAIGLAGIARAEPLDERQIPADTRWVAHFDLDAARNTAVVWAVLEQVVHRDPARQSLQQIGQVAGLESARDLHSVTFFGRRFQPLEGVVIVRARVNQERLLERVGTRPDYRVLDHRGHQVHTWTENQGKKNQSSVAGCFYQPEVIVFARQLDAVRQTLDVMDGAAPSVAGQNWPWAGPAPAGTVLTVRAVGLAEAKVPFMSPLVRKSEFLGVDFGERDGQVSLRARLDVQTAETAGQVRKVVEGLLAMGLLEVGDNAAAVGVLRRVQIAGEGRTVSVDWQVPAPELLGLLASLHAPPAQP